MIALIIILIILLVSTILKNNELLEENKRLKKMLEANQQFSEKVVQEEKDVKNLKVEDVLDNQTKEIQQASVKKLNVENKAQEIVVQKLNEEKKLQEQQAIREQMAKKEKERKNVAILVTGAFCIVLSAIVFLMSTWDSIPDILKTIVLSLLTLVFFGGSYIAKDKFKLEKTSQTFFYIAMAYIPICLLSISIFGLFGNYLSIYGDGRFIYLMFSSIFVAIIYYIAYANKYNEYLLYGSLLSQIFSVIAFSLIFSNDILLLGINLLLYNLLLILLTKDELFVKVYNFIPAIVSAISLYMLFEQSKLMIIILGLLVLNFLILELKNHDKIYAYIFNIVLMIFEAYTINVYNEFLGNNISHFIILLLVLATYVAEKLVFLYTNRKELVESSTIITLFTIGILHFESFINSNIITPYVLSIVQIILLIITYKESNKISKDIITVLIPIYFIVTGISIIIDLKLSYHAYIIFAFITFVIGELFRKKDKKIHSNAFLISHIFLAITYLNAFMENWDYFNNDIIYALLLTGLYIYSYFIEKKSVFKYLSYITSNLILFTSFEFFIGESQIMYFIPMIDTLIIMGIEIYYKELQDENSDMYLGISKVISFIAIYLLADSNSELTTVLAIIFAIILIIDNVKNRDESWNIVPLVCVIPAIFFNHLDSELGLGIMLLSVIATSAMSLKEKKSSLFTMFSGIYLIITSLNIDNIYLKEILFICWTIVHTLFITDTKENDVFKFLASLSILFLYNTSIIDLGIETYTAFYMLGYVIISIFTIRTILIKYVEDIDFLEYFVFGCIYLIALGQYNDESDGMLFGFLLVMIIMISYMKRYGALFMITILAIIVNVFLLTRNFWFSIPWWIYLLTIGALLIGFAIKNEVSDKKAELNAVNLLKNIKDKIEK